MAADTSGDTVSCKPALSKGRGTFDKNHFVEICRENAMRLAHGHCFVRACAIEMHMDISQGPFCTEIYMENAGHPGFPGNHLD